MSDSVVMYGVMPYYDTTLLQVTVPPIFEQTISNVIAFVPRLVAGVLILLIGWLIGRVVARVVMTLTDRTELDKAVLKTPLGTLLGGSQKGVSKAFGKIGAYFVYAVAFLAAAEALAVPLLSQWVASAVSYLPSFIAGLLIITIGFVLADFVGDTIMRTRAATEMRFTGAFATGTRLFLYFVVTVIGLGTMGVDTAILETFAQALAYGLGAAVAIGAGIALGWGSKDYVASHIDGWVSGSSSYVSGGRSDVSGGAAQADGGIVDED